MTSMNKGTNTLVILASYPRRFSRLFAYLCAIVSGLFFVLYPPVTTTSYLNSSVPTIMWGALLLIGGCISTYAWFSRILIVDRIGLSVICTGLVAATINQAAILYDSASWTRGGTLVLFMFATSFVVSRWQDVKHDEKANSEALEAMSG